ncbi:pH-response regulator protein palH/rim21 [Agyrium rufum]|nr:pH-response regulator protein palH/rim21 [Agyrium rufum]
MADRLQPRQIWATPTATTSASHWHCTPFELPSDGVITYGENAVLTLTRNAIFSPQCTGLAKSNASEGSGSGRDPFYASTTPQIYAIAAATVISYTLAIMLFITPRTFFIGGPGGGGGFLGQRGMIGGASGSNSVVGVGSRPWLQKVATVTVAISLTIATVNTFRVAQEQYDLGYENASVLTEEVVGGVELRVIRVISDTFLWLAQVQTLIRLFPRHREKVMIKWFGFGLIILDTLFSILNSFVSNTAKEKPRSFDDAIPALNYLFELAVSLFYAACVIYYALDKRRFAFIHRLMPNICLVAALSLTAVMIPVVFFVLDISKPDVVGWGDYMRWVGAAAASVVVWEWVERIEALEREERKEGILGREIFDEDEVLDVTSAMEVNWTGPRRGGGSPGGGGESGSGGVLRRIPWPGTTNGNRLTPQNRVQNDGYRNPLRRRLGLTTGNESSHANGSIWPTHVSQISQPQNPSIPEPVASPVSRNDTTSAASTMYAVRYHPISASTTPGPEMAVESPLPPPTPQIRLARIPTAGDVRPQDAHLDVVDRSIVEQANDPSLESSENRLNRGLEQDDSTQILPTNDRGRSGPTGGDGRFPGLMSRFSNVVDYLRPRTDTQEHLAPLPNYYVPAQPRRRIWAPETKVLTGPATVPGTVRPIGEADTERDLFSQRGSLLIREQGLPRNPNRFARSSSNPSQPLIIHPSPHLSPPGLRSDITENLHDASGPPTGPNISA